MKPPGHGALRKGRVSQGGLTYFITISSSTTLELPFQEKILKAWQRELQCLGEDKTAEVRCACLMPDHAHILLVLGDKLSLGRVVARLKTKLSLQSNYRLKWQRAYYDHALRKEEALTPVMLYIFLNPYRACLTGRGQVWSGFYCGEKDWKWFQACLDQDLPKPEWM